MCPSFLVGRAREGGLSNSFRKLLFLFGLCFLNCPDWTMLCKGKGSRCVGGRVLFFLPEGCKLMSKLDKNGENRNAQ